MAMIEPNMLNMLLANQQQVQQQQAPRFGFSGGMPGGGMLGGGQGMPQGMGAPGAGMGMQPPQGMGGGMMPGGMGMPGMSGGGMTSMPSGQALSSIMQNPQAIQGLMAMLSQQAPNTPNRMIAQAAPQQAAAQPLPVTQQPQQPWPQPASQGGDGGGNG